MCMIFFLRGSLMWIGYSRLFVMWWKKLWGIMCKRLVGWSLCGEMMNWKVV